MLFSRDFLCSTLMMPSGSIRFTGLLRKFQSMLQLRMNV